MRVISIANRFKKLPSEILRIEDSYTAFCFDEVCDFLITNIENERYPIFKDEDIFKKQREEVEKKNKKEKSEKNNSNERINFIEKLKENGEI